MSPRGVFIAGAHTDVGKTFVACGLIAAVRAAGRSVDALKPVASGFDPADWVGSDCGRLLTALGRPLDEAGLDAITPWRFAEPLAPPMAARQEGRALPLEAVTRLCRDRLAASRADLLIIEGAGGLMSPLADDATNLDLMLALNLPAILVGGSYLGAISHTLTALEVLRARGQAVVAVVMSQDAGPDAPDFSASVALLGQYVDATQVLAAPRGEAGDWAPALAAHLAMSATA